MCKICEAQGLAVNCQECDGFDWVSDVYVWEKNPDAFDKTLCQSCLKKWRRVIGFEKGKGTYDRASR
jgi:RecJ-like exonuclease